jgi:hypothetical protein
MRHAIRSQAGNKLPMALGADTLPESILIDYARNDAESV